MEQNGVPVSKLASTAGPISFFTIFEGTFPALKPGILNFFFWLLNSLAKSSLSDAQGTVTSNDRVKESLFFRLVFIKRCTKVKYHIGLRKGFYTGLYWFCLLLEQEDSIANLILISSSSITPFNTGLKDISAN